MTLNQDSVILKLLKMGLIAKESIRGNYTLVATGTQHVKRPALMQKYCTEPYPGRYLWNIEAINHDKELVRASRNVRPHRTLRVDSYGSSSHGSQLGHTGEALARIAPDADGVRRSYGVEYEIYSMDDNQRSELAYVLDTLPAYELHEDGSLGYGGLEVVFDPVGEADYIRIVKTMRQFVESNNVVMEQGERAAGMHTTFGVSNSEVTSKMDLQIRLNRIMSLVRTCMTMAAVKRVFGRFFTYYAALPSEYNFETMSHTMAASTHGRPTVCWEFRLPNWKCDPEKVVQFLKATEWAFHRVQNGDDMAKLVKLIADWN